MRSRLRRLQEKQVEKNLYMSIAGIVGIILFLLIFGMPLLINFSNLLAKKDAVGDKKNQSNAFIAPPLLDVPYDATNSAKISISGTATSGEKVKLYVNDEVAEIADIQKDGDFEFDNIVLKEGVNVLKAVALGENDSKSDFSDSVEIKYLKKAPTLTLESPNNDESFSGDRNPIAVKGKTDPGVKVTVNGFWAIVQDDGAFSHDLRLKDGENSIKIVAEDEAGNKTEQERKVKYSP